MVHGPVLHLPQVHIQAYPGPATAASWQFRVLLLHHHLDGLDNFVSPPSTALQILIYDILTTETSL